MAYGFFLHIRICWIQCNGHSATFRSPKVKLRECSGAEARDTQPSPRRCVHFMPEVSKLFGRSSDLQASYLLQLPSPRLDQCFTWSVRSCLPLRGNSGFSPDSLLSPTLRNRAPESSLNIEQALRGGQCRVETTGRSWP